MTWNKHGHADGRRRAFPPAGMSVGELAADTGVSVRTLHYYDDLGLLRPAERSVAGYRIYREGDVERLRRILTLRGLGVPLSGVAELLDPKVEPGAVLAALRKQRAATSRRIGDEAARLARIDDAISELEERNAMASKDFSELGDVDQYMDEAADRWGDTEAYQESARRMGSYSAADVARLRAEQAEQLQAFADIMTAGVKPDEPRAMAAAEEARRYIDRWFYPCPPELHRSLAAMYVGDERFTATYEHVHPGLARYVHDAVNANADRAAASATD